MNPKYSAYKLHARIDWMDRFLDLASYIRGEKNSLDQIRSYYRINYLAYRHYHSQDGFMHFRISKNGYFTDEDVYYQPDFVAQYIKKGSRVLELGFGQGANLLYLAHSHPEAVFYGADLSPLRADDVPDNVRTFQMDYSNLSRFKDDSIDVVYAVETIVHNTDKEKIFCEIRRVLKPGGVFVFFDYALNAGYATYDRQTRMAIALISKGAASAMIESREELSRHLRNSGLKEAHTADVTRYTLPDLKRLERKANKILSRPMLADLMFKTLPEQFVTNIIIGYLGYDACNSGVISYQEWVWKK